MTRAKQVLMSLLVLVVTLGAGATAVAAPPQPVVVELFTSHGCSSCPPADALLRRLVAASPVAGAQVIALSEHVDYWDNLGWTDRFSGAQFTQRQQSYAQNVFGSDQVYTPQMVIDGRSQVVGSQPAAVRAKIDHAVGQADLPVSLTLDPANDGRVGVHVTVASRRSNGAATLWLALTQDHAVSKIGGGENAGRRLREDAVVRRLVPAGMIPAENHTRRRYDASLALPDGVASNNLAVVAFVQRQESQAIVGAARRQLP